MPRSTEPTTVLPDPAAVFASALSLWQACKQESTGTDSPSLSECYNGMDQFMRELMRVATHFEAWACWHINFDELNDVWPYLLEDKFGQACLAVIPRNALAEFADTDCLRVAIRLRLPIKLDDTLPVPILVTAHNPVPNSVFRQFRIQTVRDEVDSEDPTPFTSTDDPFDEQFGVPYFSLYGVSDEGELELIADRQTYAATVALAQKLAPGMEFPTSPTLSAPPPPSPDHATR